MGCMLLRSLAVLTAGLVLALSSAANAQQPKSGGTLRVAFEADVTGFDPHLVPGLQNYYVNQNLFNTLVGIDPQLGFVPDLAAFWEALEAGQVYVFRLHKGVKFHDGTDCDAAAVKWNLERVITDPKSAQGKFLPHVAAVDVVDAHTIKITMKYPSSTLLESLAFNGAGVMILSPSAAQTYGNDLPRHPVGTGPFKLAKWEQNSIIVLECNPQYFKPGLPYLDRVEYRIMKDGVTRATALRAGEVDFVNWLPREHAERVGKDPKIQVLRGPESSKDYDQTVNIALPFGSAYARAWVLERGSLNIPNHDDPKVDALFERYRRAVDFDEQQRVAAEIQRYFAETMLYMTVTGYPILQANRTTVKGYPYMRGMKVLFETTWLEP
jgi:ABC-type transport system substrate-binding protein